MIITLVGMSGSGKSHWSQQIARLGFDRVCIDDLIEARLYKELAPLGYRGVNDMAKWLGQPYEQTYARRCQVYLDLETATMDEALTTLALTSQPAVLDTTGSVIYLSPTILKRLTECSIVVYLHTSLSAHKAMTELYLSDPKPVIWGKVFNQRPNESAERAITRCYPLLLRYRTAKYQQLAHITLDYEQLRSPAMTASTIINTVKDARHD